jgi:hypothetical protein
MLPAAPALFLDDEGLPEGTGHNVGSGRPASAEDVVFGKEDARVGTVIRTASRCHVIQPKLPVGAGLSRRRMACAFTLSLPIGSYIPVPGVDPAAFARVMALEDRSVLS